MNDTEKKRIAIVSMYNNFVKWVMFHMSDTEETIIELPDLGTVVDGGKAYYSAELRYLISMLLTEYYSTENLNKWDEFKLLLTSKLENELDYNRDGYRTTSIISKNWATRWFLECMGREEEDMKTRSEVENVFDD